MKEGKKYLNIRKSFCIHPDIQEAFKNYKGKNAPNPFKQVFKERDKIIADDPNDTYWNTDHDVEMLETARERSQRRDFKYPSKRNDPTYEQQLARFREKLKEIWR